MHNLYSQYYTEEEKAWLEEMNRDPKAWDRWLEKNMPMLKPRRKSFEEKEREYLDHLLKIVKEEFYNG